MTSPRTYESELLTPAERVLEDFTSRQKSRSPDARFQLLEAAASRLGGFSLLAYQKQFQIDSIISPDKLVQEAKVLVETIERSGIHPSLALSALAREHLDSSSQRTTGAYHTDFRLAKRLAELAAPKAKAGTKVIDPACGAGILLVALSLQACGADRKKLVKWLAESVYAADLSPTALRGSLLALSSLTNDLGALHSMRAKWIVGDSLTTDEKTWRCLAPEGFDVVIGNPPWEKIKLTRHEYLKSKGHNRHYGAEVGHFDQASFEKEKVDVADYARRLVQRYPSLVSGEPDLYIAFTELFERLCKSSGVMAALVPAGFIRSQGTAAMRRHLLDVSEQVSISVIENRARFFSIDTRFKFLAIACTKAGNDHKRRSPITLLHERGSPSGTEQFGSARIGRDRLAIVRPDLSLPEVRSSREWQIYQKVSAAGVMWEEPGFGWRPEFCREVDMTRERSKFINSHSKDALPVIEGRMVQQHRFGAKGYIEGTGRKAVWEGFPLGLSRLQPQFYIREKDIPSGSRQRSHSTRGGFCDITGQTNERSMMAALIPPGVICGNKVPSILFPDDPSDERLLVWTAVMNSLPFDWMLRRVMTTTVNYFLLLSLPMPRLVKEGLPWRRLVRATRELRTIDSAGGSDKLALRWAELRAEVDAEIAVAYKLNLEDFIVMMADFPLLDRGQPPLPGEQRSTITKDVALTALAKRTGANIEPFATRAEHAIRLGARAYVPSEFLGVGEMAGERTANDN